MLVLASNGPITLTADPFITHAQRYLKHVEETEDAYNHSDYDKQKKRPPPRRPSLEV